jgi:hypothetical protein
MVMIVCAAVSVQITRLGSGVEGVGDEEGSESDSRSEEDAEDDSVGVGDNLGGAVIVEVGDESDSSDCESEVVVVSSSSSDGVDCLAALADVVTEPDTGTMGRPLMGFIACTDVCCDCWGRAEMREVRASRVVGNARSERMVADVCCSAIAQADDG